MTFKTFLPLGLLFLSFLCPCPGQSYNILFYYNSGDGTEGALLQCVAILQRAGHQVDTVDVRGGSRDPRNDNWGAPYDQVWDMRFIDRQSDQCGSGNPRAADYFDGNWRLKSVSFLNHCGKLFIAAEHYLLPDRNEGLYAFLAQIQAVKSGFDPCAPSARGNNSTGGEAFYPVHHGLGPVSFYGAWVGGIPLIYLTGTSFVDTKEDWDGDDVDRSVVSGWNGNQLGGAVTAGSCGRGKLFMVWDATMWTLWQPGMYGEERTGSPVWDDSAWVPGNIQSPAGSILHVRAAKRVTASFFPAVAKWLGSGDCPCAEASSPILPPAPVPVQPSGGNQYQLQVFPGPSAPTGSLLSVPHPPSTGHILPSADAPGTIAFSAFPLNIYMGFRDGMGNYQLSIVDSQGGLIQIIFDRSITTEKESWAAWNGNDVAGREVPPGLYYAVLSKAGRFLRKIALLRLKG